MPLKEDKGVRVTNQPRLHRNSSLLQAIWHRGVNTFCPMLNAARVEHVSEQTSQLLRDSGGVTWSVFFFFFFRVLCERKEKKKKKESQLLKQCPLWPRALHAKM